MELDPSRIEVVFPPLGETHLGKAIASQMEEVLLREMDSILASEAVREAMLNDVVEGIVQLMDRETDERVLVTRGPNWSGSTTS